MRMHDLEESILGNKEIDRNKDHVAAWFDIELCRGKERGSSICFQPLLALRGITKFLEADDTSTHSRADRAEPSRSSAYLHPPLWHPVFAGVEGGLGGWSRPPLSLC